MTTGRINQVAALDCSACAEQSRRVDAEAPQRTGRFVQVHRLVRLLAKSPAQWKPFLLLSIGIFPGSRGKPGSGNISWIGLPRRPSCRSPASRSSPKRETEPVSPANALLGVYALRRPHKLRVQLEPSAVERVHAMRIPCLGVACWPALLGYRDPH